VRYAFAVRPLSVLLLLALACCAHREPIPRESPDSAALVPSVHAPTAATPSTGAPTGSASSAATSPVTAPVGASEEGRIHALATHQPHPAHGMAADASNVYWANATSGTVMSVPIRGGEPVTLASSPHDSPHSVAVDATNVYWATDSSIMKAPLGGGAASVVGKAYEADAVAVDEQNVYWGALSTIEAAPIGGGKTTTVVFNPGRPMGLAFRDGNILWADDRDRRVMTLKLGTHNRTVLASGGQNCQNLAVDATYAYWTDTGAGTVSRVPLAGGNPVTLATGQDGPGAIAVDTGNVYWTTRTSVMKLSLHGGTPHYVAADRRPVSIALDATSIYWLDEGDRFKGYSDGSVMKAPK
jgi:hypothetical protein